MEEGVEEVRVLVGAVPVPEVVKKSVLYRYLNSWGLPKPKKVCFSAPLLQFPANGGKRSIIIDFMHGSCPPLHLTSHASSLRRSNRHIPHAPCPLPHHIMPALPRTDLEGRHVRFLDPYGWDLNIGDEQHRAWNDH